jgi:hypothetical protein
MRRDDICIYVNPANRTGLEAIITDRNSMSKAVWRAEIVLATADELGTNVIMRSTGKSKPCRLAVAGALCRERCRGIAALREAAAHLEATVGCREAQCADRDGERNAYWSVRSMAAAVGISHTRVQRTLAESGIKPRLVPRFKIPTTGSSRKSERCGVALHELVESGAATVRERKEPDTAARSDPAGPTREEEPGRDRDGRLQAAR